MLPCCLIHIYKCGGSTVRDYIKTNLATPGSNLIDQTAYRWELGLYEKDRLLGNLIRAEYLRNLEPTLPANSIILTHSFFYEFMKSWKRSFATMLRDPIERIVSQHAFELHIQGRPNVAWLEEESNFNFNLQTAALCGIADTEVTYHHLQMAKANLHFFDFIGLVDDFATSMAMFNRIYGITTNPEIPRLNASNHDRVPADVLAYIRKRSVYDLELVGYAKRLITAKQAAFDLLDSGNLETLPDSLAPFVRL